MNDFYSKFLRFRFKPDMQNPLTVDEIETKVIIIDHWDSVYRFRVLERFSGATRDFTNR